MRKCNICGSEKVIDLRLESVIGRKVHLIPKEKILGNNIGIIAETCKKCGNISGFKVDNIEGLKNL